MVAFPIISALLAAMCAVVIGRDALRRPRPDKVAWFIAFVMFALAAGTDAYGREVGWSEWLARLYYMTGPALVVAFLAIGELYLLFPSRMGRYAPGAAILLSAVWITLVIDAPIDSARLADEGWEAIDRSGALKVLAITINSVGTLIIVGGLIWSVWRFRQMGTHRNRMIGLLLIVAGTISVAMGGTLTRFGHYEYLYIAMAIGIALIFAGVLRTRRPDPLAATAGITEATSSSPASPVPDVALTQVSAEPQLAQELSFLVEKVLCTDASGIRELCSAWSVETRSDPMMSRRDARQAWRLRKHLPAAAQDRFDALPVPERRAVVELAAEVLQVPALVRVDDTPRASHDAVRLEG